MTDLHYLPATQALAAFRARELSPVELVTAVTLPFNIASRCPVMSVPSGLSRDGVPTGLSIVGKTYDDVTVFRIAAAHEEQMPWLDMPRRRPGL
jgi:aspartyl-tRNA(Asn)/glutamyl-tRNA(Gln) amidotransferase subunit A